MKVVFYLVTAIILATSLPSLARHAVGFRPQAIQGDDTAGVCPSSDHIQSAIKDRIRQTLRLSGLPKVQTREGDFPCAGPDWTRVMYLNMSDPAHTCPGEWQEYNHTKRTCGRADSDQRGYCNSVFVETNGVEYSRVCGRLAGYPTGTPDAFVHGISYPNNTDGWLDGHYVDGISITYGSPPPRTHIWSLASAYYEGDCPCESPYTTTRTPHFVGLNYFCERGSWTNPLWDGKGCRSDWCCSFNTPPWFSVSLDTPTREVIEVRNCGSNVRDREDVLIEVMELYIQ